MGKKIPNQTYTTPEIDLNKDTRMLLGFEVAGPALIMNRFADKTIHEMLQKHMGGDVKRTKKVPREVIEAATQRNIAGAVALPSTAIKKAVITAASVMKTFSKNKVPLRVGFFVVGASIPITYQEMVPRMDLVRTSGQTRAPDVRFRPQFNNWSARFVVRFDEDALSPALVCELVNRAGNVGVGEWRPEKSGDYGTFRIKRALPKKECEEVIDLCAPIIRPVTIPDWALDAGVTLENLQEFIDDANEAAAE